MRRTKLRKVSATSMTNKLDALVRQVIHQKYGDEPECVTCGLMTTWFHPQNNPHGMQVGHYITREKFCLRWDLLNVWPQCSRCNKNHEENPLPFTQFILRTYGQSRLDYYEKMLRDYQTGKWATMAKKLEIKEELEELLESVKRGNV